MQLSFLRKPPDIRSKNPPPSAPMLSNPGTQEDRPPCMYSIPISPHNLTCIRDHWTMSDTWRDAIPERHMHCWAIVLLQSSSGPILPPYIEECCLRNCILLRWSSPYSLRSKHFYGSDQNAILCSEKLTTEHAELIEKTGERIWKQLSASYYWFPRCAVFAQQRPIISYFAQLMMHI